MSPQYRVPTGKLFISNLNKGTFSDLKQFLTTTIPLKLKLFKLTKNAFYFTLKALLILKICNFLKFMTSQSGQQTIAIHILTNISRNIGNQAMKFCQVIEYNMSNFYFETSCTEMAEKLFANPFLKSLNLSYLCSGVSESE